MSILQDMPVFREGQRRLTLINTDLMEAESLIKILADEEKNRSSQDFAGLTSCVYFKMPYVQPCEPFQELRRLILRVREHTGLRADFRGIVAIEATEWIGHEKDEYFTVLLKYLFDHRDIWRASMVLCNATQLQLQRFASACACYLTPRPYELRFFTDREKLCGLIREGFRMRNVRAETEAVDLLADALEAPALKDARSLTLIRRVVEESICESGKLCVMTADAADDYIQSPWSCLSMMAGHKLPKERSKNIESEILQL